MSKHKINWDKILFSKLLKYSKSNKWKDAKDEWTVGDEKGIRKPLIYPMDEDELIFECNRVKPAILYNSFGHCICGHNISYYHLIHNIKTDIYYYIGSVCVKRINSVHITNEDIQNMEILPMDVQNININPLKIAHDSTIEYMYHRNLIDDSGKKFLNSLQGIQKLRITYLNLAELYNINNCFILNVSNHNLKLSLCQALKNQIEKTNNKKYELIDNETKINFINGKYPDKSYDMILKSIDKIKNERLSDIYSIDPNLEIFINPNNVHIETYFHIFDEMNKSTISNFINDLDLNNYKKELLIFLYEYDDDDIISVFIVNQLKLSDINNICDNIIDNTCLDIFVDIIQKYGCFNEFYIDDYVKNNIHNENYLRNKDIIIECISSKSAKSLNKYYYDIKWDKCKRRIYNSKYYKNSSEYIQTKIKCILTNILNKQFYIYNNICNKQFLIYNDVLENRDKLITKITVDILLLSKDKKSKYFRFFNWFKNEDIYVHRKSLSNESKEKVKSFISDIFLCDKRDLSENQLNWAKNIVKYIRKYNNEYTLFIKI